MITVDTNMGTIAETCSAILDAARSESGWHNFDGMNDNERAKIAELVAERFGVRLRWRVLEGDPRKGPPENRFKPPRIVGYYSTVRYGRLAFFEIYEGQVGDPVEDERGHGICVRSRLSWGDAGTPGWQAVAWIVADPLVLES